MASRQRGFVHYLLVFITSLVSYPTLSASLNELKFYTEFAPPHSYKENAVVTGIAVDLLLAASKAVDDEVDISQVSMIPWDQAYKNAVSNSDSVIFSTVKTKPRDNLFYWAGPIKESLVVLLAITDSNISVDNLRALSNYKIGVIRDDIGEQLLLGKGVPFNAFHEAPDLSVLVKLLYLKRVDLIAYEEAAALFVAYKHGLDTSLFSPVSVLQSGEAYFAFNKGVDPKLVERLQKGIDRVKAKANNERESEYTRILNKYKQ